MQLRHSPLRDTETSRDVLERFVVIVMGLDDRALSFWELFHDASQTTDQLAELRGRVRIGAWRLVDRLGPRFEQHAEGEPDREIH